MDHIVCFYLFLLNYALLNCLGVRKYVGKLWARWAKFVASGPPPHPPASIAENCE